MRAIAGALCVGILFALSSCARSCGHPAATTGSDATVDAPDAESPATFDAGRDALDGVTGDGASVSASTIPGIDGAWSDPPAGFDVHDLAVVGDVVLFSGRVGDVPQLRVARWTAGKLVFEAPRLVPPPAGKGAFSADEMSDTDPKLAVDETTTPAQIGVTVVEYQGGCWEVVVLPSLSSPAIEQIPPPSGEVDIRFGDPLVLRGDEILTTDARALFHLRRRDGRWDAHVDVEAPGKEEWGWQFALSPDGTTLVAPLGDGHRDDVAVLTRGGDGSFALRDRIALPSDDADGYQQLTGVAFVDTTLVVGAIHPAPDGTSLWTFDAPYHRPRGRLALPLESNGTAVHGLAARGDLAVVHQLERIWIVDVRAEKILCGLRLPPATRQKILDVDLSSRHAFVVVDGRIGVFDLDACRAASP